MQNLNDKEYGKIGAVWVQNRLFSPTMSSNSQTFLKWAIPVTTKTSKEGRRLEGKFGCEATE